MFCVKQWESFWSLWWYLAFIKSWEMIQLVFLKVGGMWKPDFKKAWLLTVECLEILVCFLWFFRGNLTNSLTGADKTIHKRHQTSWEISYCDPQAGTTQCLPNDFGAFLSKHTFEHDILSIELEHLRFKVSQNTEREACVNVSGFYSRGCWKSAINIHQQRCCASARPATGGAEQAPLV